MMRGRRVRQSPGLSADDPLVPRALLGDFPRALDDAVMASSEAHQGQMTQYLNNKELQAGFQRVVFDMLLAKRAAGAGAQDRTGRGPATRRAPRVVSSLPSTGDSWTRLPAR